MTDRSAESPQGKAVLDARDITAIRAAMALSPHRGAASIDALKIVQEHHGWVADAHIAAIAELLEVSPHELDAVATFYNLIYRRPVGRHVVHVCDSVCCWLAGADGLLHRLQERLGVAMGGTSEDGYTLLTIPCLGACDRAPALLMDGELFVAVDPNRLADILEPR